MCANASAIGMRIDEAKSYPGFTLYPFYHKSGRMPWAAACVLPIDKIEKIIWLSGETGRDPETDALPHNLEEERAGVGKVVGGIKEQTTATWMRIKEILEGLGARLEDIFCVKYYVVKRELWYDALEAQRKFFEENCPDLLVNRRAGVLLEGIELAIPEMLIEIEVYAAVVKK